MLLDVAVTVTKWKAAWVLGVYLGCPGDVVDGGMVNRMVLVLRGTGRGGHIKMSPGFVLVQEFTEVWREAKLFVISSWQCLYVVDIMES